jgi:hypothetical protein
MKQIYKITTAFALASYLGCIAGAAVYHGYRAWDAQKESEKAYYGKNLKQAWKNHAKFHLDRLTNAKTLVPLNDLYNPISKPLRIEMEGFGVNGIELKVDLIHE